MFIDLFGRYVGLFYKYIGLLGRSIGFFYRFLGLCGRSIVFFCRYIGFFNTCVGLARERRIRNQKSVVGH